MTVLHGQCGSSGLRQGIERVDVRQPRVAVHVLDSFFASRLGENLDEPSRKLMRRLVVLTDELLNLGTAGHCQATVCMESVRLLVSSLLVLL